ncbi:MAG: hypothetical protein QOH06_1445 [Acidobacteriota bacterium]|jgi:hypothetical protein|nr:hypothetical protein [Acidobacteriota bacterium]
MRKILLSALFAFALALPAAAQPTWRLGGVLVEPRHPTASDSITLTVVGDGQCYVFNPVYDETTGSVVVNLEPQDCVSVPGYFPIRETFAIGPLPAGRHLVEIPVGNDGFGRTWSELFEVGEDTALGLGEDFYVRVHWSNPRDGSSGSGHALRLARDSGAFWFFYPDNLEVTIKVLDGRAINGHWWVFIASMTDVQFEVEISREGGPVKTYVQTAGANRNFIDINASFTEGSQPGSAPDIAVYPEHPTAADLVHVQVAVLNTEPGIAFTGMEGHALVFNDNSHAYPAGEPERPLHRYTAGATAGPLAPGVYRVDVRLDDVHEFGRTFEVIPASPASPALRLGEADEDHTDIKVSYRIPGETHFATAPGVPLTRDSAYFYFFDRENAEVTAKVLDGRGVNGHWWVFLANMTTVELEIEVTHCPPQAPPAYGITKTYVQPPGQNRNFLDTSTF